MRIRPGLAASICLACTLTAHAGNTTMAADAFVRALYRPYGNADRPDPLGASAPRYFAPRLLRLIRSDEDVPIGDIGKLDEDPLCDCQDDGGFRLSSITINPLSADRVVARVVFAIRVFRKVITLDLVNGGGGWRIADVHSRRIPSLFSFLSDTGAPLQAQHIAPR